MLVAGWLAGLELPGWADCAVLAAVVVSFGGAVAGAGAAVCCPASVLVIASASSIPAKKRISVEIVCQRIGGCRVSNPVSSSDGNHSPPFDFALSKNVPGESVWAV